MQFTTTGGYNTAVGAISLYANTSGEQNVAVGREAARRNTTGNYNVALGFQTLSNNTTGSNITALGYYALGVATTGTVNTAVGYLSGSAITTGSKNTILGGYTGNQGGLDIRTGNNWIVLSDGDGNPRVIYQPTRNNVGLQSSTTAVSRLEGMEQVTVANGSTVTLTNTELGAAMVCVYDNASGNGAVFFANYYGATILVASDNSTSFATSDTAGKFCVYKNSGSHTVSFKNNTGGNTPMTFVLYSAQAATN
jgi:hypothetical protein